MYHKPLYWTTMTALALLALAWAAWPAGQDRPAPPTAFPAIAQARWDLKLGFTVSGRVAKIAARPGDKVKAGQLLVELEDKEGESLVALYKLRKDNDLEVQAAKAKAVMAKVEEDRLKQLLDAGGGSDIEYRRALVATKVADLSVDAASQQMKETEEQYRQALARHDQYRINAPVDGTVIMLTIEPGEIAEAPKPILRLVNTDPLWVDVPVPTQFILKNLKAGDPATVIATLDPKAEPLPGKIIFLPPVHDAASETGLLALEVPNPKGAIAGTQVTVSFGK